MGGSVVLLIFIVGVGFAGLLLRDRARRDSNRWRLLLLSSHPGLKIVASPQNEPSVVAFHLDGRDLTMQAAAPHVTLTTPLPTPPLPWPQAARALGDGELLAALMAPEVSHGDGRLVLRLPMKTLRGRHLRTATARVLGLAGRLETLPMDAALARHVLDFAPPSERENAFVTLCTLHPDSEATRQCALACLDEEEHPSLVALAKAHLATCTAPAVGATGP